MRTVDFSPLHRSTVGFDRVFDLLDQASRADGMANWPPYDIERLDDDAYRISMAVAGFAPEQIEVVQHESRLLVKGHKPDRGDAEYLHRGIAHRSFTQVFNLADHVMVKSADLHNGLLVINLQRELPERLKPRRVEIASESGGPGPRMTEVAQDDREAA